MSKARVAVTLYQHPTIINDEHQTVKYLLNPLDLPEGMQVTSYDTYNIHPVPLIRNASLTGQFICLDNNLYLPAGMRFGIDFLQPSATG